jgi:hypothetical protein
MCIKIPAQRKEQPAVGLPAGWTFIFEEENKSNPKKAYIPGLFIFHPKKKKPFRSMEVSAIWHQNCLLYMLLCVWSHGGERNSW